MSNGNDLATFIGQRHECRCLRLDRRSFISYG